MDKLVQSPNGITRPSEYKVNYVRLHTQTSDTPLDITKMINYVEIYESIYSPFLTVNVNITDNLSLTDLLPLMGEEFIEVDIRGADNLTGLIGQTFYIYKVADRTKVSDKTYTYTLGCISPGAIFDMNLKISQAMFGQPSDLVKDKLCGTSLAVDKPVYAHPTKYPVSYISNYWSPIRNIKYLCDRSVSKDTGSASYLFFETIKGFNFIPLDILASQESVGDYFYTNNIQVPDIAAQQQIIHNLYVDEQFNYINRIMTGAYGNRALFVDTMSKQYQYQYYDFLESYNKFARLNEKPFATDTATRRINSVFRKLTYASKAIPNMPDQHSPEWFKQRLTELASINSQTINFDAVGRFNIQVGNVVNVVVPVSTVSASDAVRKDLSSTIDRALSGRYMITGLKHMLDRERHTIHVQASKDSMVKIPSRG